MENIIIKHHLLYRGQTILGGIWVISCGTGIQIQLAITELSTDVVTINTEAIRWSPSAAVQWLRFPICLCNASFVPPCTVGWLYKNTNVCNGILYRPILQGLKSSVSTQERHGSWGHCCSHQWQCCSLQLTPAWRRLTPPHRKYWSVLLYAVCASINHAVCTCMYIICTSVVYTGTAIHLL